MHRTPKETTNTPQLTPLQADVVSTSQQNLSPTSTLPLYVGLATPYPVMSEPVRSPTVTIPTPIPEVYVLIYGTANYYASNKTTITFNLVNPPMRINFSVKTYNVSGTKIVSSRSGGGDTKEDVVKYSYYNPYAYYEITIRDRTTGEIIAQDGFQHGHDANPENRTWKVFDRGDFLIEMGGNNVTTSINISVKKEGNLDSFNITALNPT